MVGNVDEDADLREVVALLPPAVAELILGISSPNGRRYVLERMRTAISTWESRGLTFDPVTLAVLIETFAVQAMGAWAAILTIIESQETLQGDQGLEECS